MFGITGYALPLPLVQCFIQRRWPRPVQSLRIVLPRPSSLSSLHTAIISRARDQVAFLAHFTQAHALVLFSVDLSLLFFLSVKFL